LERRKVPQGQLEVVINQKIFVSFCRYAENKFGQEEKHCSFSTAQSQPTQMILLSEMSLWKRGPALWNLN
jgi:hypothetical protein